MPSSAMARRAVCEQPLPVGRVDPGSGHHLGPTHRAGLVLEPIVRAAHGVPVQVLLLGEGFLKGRHPPLYGCITHVSSR